ncbi:acyltransferase [Corynebacterium sp.]|mgnify:CR=1 FL=1|uniref:acyltransferase family protein n=1 Tax=Corynebacterium sp. TaxID=1720 RepID=UPI0025B87377|nr:acyltransferase [Corynebacterium sp.]
MTSNKIRQETAVATGHAPSPPSRNLPVDTLRGVACLLLVSFHVIGYDSTDGLHVADDSALRYYTDSVDYLRMPLFTLLSGLVYAWRPLHAPGGYLTFMGKKARRLLVPYVIFVPAIGLTQVYLDGTNSSRDLDPLNWLLFSLSPYWFLLTTFWFFAVVALADSRSLLSSRLTFGVVFCASLAVVLVTHTEQFRFLQVGQALTLAPFFLAGVAMSRFSLVPTTPATRWGSTAVLVLAAVVVQLALTGAMPGTDGAFDSRHSLVGVGLGILFPLVFLGWSLANRQLAWIGGYSSGIFLLHSFAIGAVRVLTDASGLTDAVSPPVLVVGLTVGGVALSILGVTVLRRWRVGRVVLGEKPQAGRGSR